MSWEGCGREAVVLAGVVWCGGEVSEAAWVSSGGGVPRGRVGHAELLGGVSSLAACGCSVCSQWPGVVGVLGWGLPGSQP